jgi:hypothetical protein
MGDSRFGLLAIPRRGLPPKGIRPPAGSQQRVENGYRLGPVHLSPACILPGSWRSVLQRAFSHPRRKLKQGAFQHSKALSLPATIALWGRLTPRHPTRLKKQGGASKRGPGPCRVAPLRSTIRQTPVSYSTLPYPPTVASLTPCRYLTPAFIHPFNS